MTSKLRLWKTYSRRSCIESGTDSARGPLSYNSRNPALETPLWHILCAVRATESREPREKLIQSRGRTGVAVNSGLAGCCTVRPCSSLPTFQTNQKT